MASLTIETKDRLNKGSSLTIAVQDAIADAAVTALRDALAGIILGTLPSAKKSTTTTIEVGEEGPADDKAANRGNKWLFRTFVALDNQGSGKVYTNELGTVDSSVLPSADADFVDLTAGLGLAVKNAWDAAYRSKQGNPGVLLSIQQLTREETK